jgi:hypothetical protein
MKREYHDMHYGVPKWALPDTHNKIDADIMDESGIPDIEEHLNNLAGRRVTNKLVAKIGSRTYKGELCDIYAYSYDGHFYGSFLAEPEDKENKVQGYKDTLFGAFEDTVKHHGITDLLLLDSGCNGHKFALYKGDKPIFSSADISEVRIFIEGLKYAMDASKELQAKADSLQKKLDHNHQKWEHGCTDMYCEHCDG